MAESIPGYGDPQCFNCKIILDKEMAGLCISMVFFTRQQERCARNKPPNLIGASFYENLQNNLALKMLKCKPGTNRV